MRPYSRSVSSTDSDESYTTRLLNRVRRQEEHFNATVRLWEALNNGTPLPESPSQCSDCHEGGASSSGYMSHPPPSALVMRAHGETAILDRARRCRRCGSGLENSPPWILRRALTLDKKSRSNWAMNFKAFWESMLICLGYKSVSGPD